MKKITPEMLLEAADRLEEAIAMPSVLKVAGLNWGFYSDEEPRMHIQAMHGKHPYKVWLERRGDRIFEPANDVPTAVLKRLKLELGSKEDRAENMWCGLMIDLGRVAFSVAAGSVTLTMYPGTHNSYQRTFSLPEKAGRSTVSLSKRDMELDSESAALIVGTDRPEDRWSYVRLAPIVFTGSR